jgi:hypothetical protein
MEKRWEWSEGYYDKSSVHSSLLLFWCPEQIIDVSVQLLKEKSEYEPVIEEELHGKVYVLSFLLCQVYIPFQNRPTANIRFSQNLYCWYRG